MRGRLHDACSRWVEQEGCSERELYALYQADELQGERGLDAMCDRDCNVALVPKVRHDHPLCTNQ